MSLIADRTPAPFPIPGGSLTRFATLSIPAPRTAAHRIDRVADTADRHAYPAAWLLHPTTGRPPARWTCRAWPLRRPARRVVTR